MINELKNISFPLKILYIVVLALFLPMIPSSIVMVIALFILLFKGYLIESYKSIKGSYFILAFTLLEFIVSIIYQNWIGFGFTALLFLFFSLSIVLRKYVTASFFNIMTKTIMLLSLVTCLVGFIQYLFILKEFKLDEFQIIVFNTPEHRIHAMYFNSNYYAMMLNFFIAITLYRIIKYKDNIKYTLGKIVIILINLFTLYLTGCRTAWPALLAGLLLLLILSGFYKLFYAFVFGGGLAGGFLITHPHLISRFSNISKYLGVRRNIWRVALLNIKSHPLFGEGPMTYWHIYSQYKNAHPTQHSHNIFIDPLLSFGIVGLLVILPYPLYVIKSLRKSKKDPLLLGLIWSFVLMTIVHGFLDYTIFFVQTATLFLFITASIGMYEKDL